MSVFRLIGHDTQLGLVVLCHLQGPIALFILVSSAGFFRHLGVVLYFFRHLGGCTLGFAGSHHGRSGSAGQALLHPFLLRVGSKASYLAVKRYFADCLALHRQGQGEALATVTAVVTGWVAMRCLCELQRILLGDGPCWLLMRLHCQVSLGR